MPPLHPNCQCSVAALDNASSLVYDLNRQGFMSAVEVMLENSDGGIWTMSNSDTNGNMRVGYVPFEIRPIAVSEEPTITDDTGQFPIIDSVINWARDFGEDAAEFLQQFWDSARQRADHRYEDFWSFWDWVNSGIISGIWNSAEARAELLLSDPSLYNIINWLMLGLPDLTGRVFDPDKPLSFEHCLANLELVTILFGVYNVYQRHAAAMAAPMLDDPGIPRGSQDYEFNEREIVYGSETKSSAKLFRQMQNRGWSFSDVEEVVRRPFTTRQSINKATGNPATVFYNRDGTYIIVDDVTNALVQISDKYDPNWVPDASIINPYRP